MSLPLSRAEPIFDPRDWSIIGFNCYDYAIGYKDKVNNKKPHPIKSTPGERAGMPVNNLSTCAGVKSGILADNPGSIYESKNPNKPCKSGFYKIMCFISPNNDYHFYRQVQTCRYKIRPGNTINGLAAFFHVTPSVILAASKKVKNPTNNTDGNINSNSTESNSNMNKTMRNSGRNKYDSILKVGKIIEFPCNLWAHKQGWGTRPKIVDAAGKTITDPRKCMRDYSAASGMNYTTLCGVYCVDAARAKSGANSGLINLKKSRPIINNSNNRNVVRRNRNVVRRNRNIKPLNSKLA
jgi:hypothetical protein